MAIDVSSWNAAADQINNLQGVAQYNNAWSAAQANAQNQFQIQQNAKAMDFNQMEAAKNRAWQEFMSNTAHQREVRDLRAAGLNPVLSAMNGNGAAVTSGATAQGVTSAGSKGDTDTSVNAAIANVLGSVLDADYKLQAANISARAQEAVADKYTAMENIVANISADASRYAADKHYEGSELSAAATRAAAASSASAARYTADRAYSAVADFPTTDRLVGGVLSGAVGGPEGAGSGVASGLSGAWNFIKGLFNRPGWTEEKKKTPSTPSHKERPSGSHSF